MKILVCGGRNYDDWETFRKVLWKYYVEGLRTPVDGKSSLEIISGMARGADSMAVSFAKTFGLKLHEYPADWAWHGKGAGAIRNRQMLNEGKPDLVVAFPGGVGTYHMISIAKRAGVRVIEIEGPYRGEVSY